MDEKAIAIASTWFFYNNYYYYHHYVGPDDQYYKYDDDNDQVAPGYPRSIAADFGGGANCTEAVPNNLDTVLFDNRDSLLYFFKGPWV